MNNAITTEQLTAAVKDPAVIAMINALYAIRDAIHAAPTPAAENEIGHAAMHIVEAVWRQIDSQDNQ